MTRPTLDLDTRLAALRTAPPDNGFDDRLRARLQEAAVEMAQSTPGVSVNERFDALIRRVRTGFLAVVFVVTGGALAAASWAGYRTLTEPDAPEKATEPSAVQIRPVGEALSKPRRLKRPPLAEETAEKRPSIQLQRLTPDIQRAARPQLPSTARPPTPQRPTSSPDQRLVPEPQPLKRSLAIQPRQRAERRRPAPARAETPDLPPSGDAAPQTTRTALPQPLPSGRPPLRRLRIRTDRPVNSAPTPTAATNLPHPTSPGPGPTSATVAQSEPPSKPPLKRLRIGTTEPTISDQHRPSPPGHFGKRERRSAGDRPAVPTRLTSRDSRRPARPDLRDRHRQPSLTEPQPTEPSPQPPRHRHRHATDVLPCLTD